MMSMPPSHPFWVDAESRVKYLGEPAAMDRHTTNTPTPRPGFIVDLGTHTHTVDIGKGYTD
jgi:hypothetical protein